MRFPDEHYDYDKLSKNSIFVGACLFYLKNGFVIGGLDTHVYVGTSQEEKSDILFYLDTDK